METLLHEQVHLWQQNFGKDPVKPGRVYHNKEFVEKCESLGLHPKIGEGYHLKLADGPFEILMRELGITPPDLSSNRRTSTGTGSSGCWILWARSPRASRR